MPKKTNEEIKAWVEDKKTKQSETLVVADEVTGSSCVPRVKVEVTKP